jgi:hypothetical protein
MTKSKTFLYHNETHTKKPKTKTKKGAIDKIPKYVKYAATNIITETITITPGMVTNRTYKRLGASR